MNRRQRLKRVDGRSRNWGWFSEEHILGGLRPKEKSEAGDVVNSIKIREKVHKGRFQKRLKGESSRTEGESNCDKAWQDQEIGEKRRGEIKNKLPNDRKSTVVDAGKTRPKRI